MLTKYDAVQPGDVVRVRESVPENAEWRDHYGELGIVVDVWDQEGKYADGKPMQIVWVRPVFKAGTAYLGKLTPDAAGIFSREQVRPLERNVGGKVMKFESKKPWA